MLTIRYPKKVVWPMCHYFLVYFENETHEFSAIYNNGICRTVTKNVNWIHFLLKMSSGFINILNSNINQLKNNLL